MDECPSCGGEMDLDGEEVVVSGAIETAGAVISGTRTVLVWRCQDCGHIESTEMRAQED